MEAHFYIRGDLYKGYKIIITNSYIMYIVRRTNLLSIPIIKLHWSYIVSVIKYYVERW